MRPGNQSNKRIRGRGRKGPNPLSRTYESNGPDVKIRGTAHHVAEKYQQLARDAAAAGDRVMSENYFQHAEHYLRIIAAAQQSMQQPVVLPRGDDADDDGDEAEERIERNERREREERRDRDAAPAKPVMPLDAPQPFVDNIPVLNSKAASNGPAEDGDDEGEAGAEGDERSRRRVRGARGRGMRRNRPGAGEDAGGEAATAPETLNGHGKPDGDSDSAPSGEAAGETEKKPRARRAPRARAAKPADAEAAPSEA